MDLKKDLISISIILSFVLIGCKSSSVYVKFKGTIDTTVGEHFFQPTNYSRFLLRLKGLKTPENKKLNYEVLFKGKNENFIGVVNYYGGFQDPKFLVFFQSGEMKIIHDSFDAEKIYIEYLHFINENRDEIDNPEQIWPKLLNYVNLELLNKYSKITFP